MDSSLSCHSTKATLYKIDRLEKDDNIVIKILFATAKLRKLFFQHYINRGAQSISDSEHL